jgi:hypothetical protein
MSSGKLMSWRLLSPFAVLLWVVATVGFAGIAHAETGTDPDAVQVAVDEPQAAADAPAAPAPDEHAADAAAAAPNSGSSSGSDSAGTSGDVTEPQPISNADANTGGANGQCPDGPYCSTRDGSASGNGSGGGNATGEPCAGCVGKADNKNPGGQMPDASDANAGYECDTNHGIAQTNPAHTGCVTPPEQECVPTPTVPCEQPPVCVPTPTVPCEQPPVCVPTPTVPCVSPPLVGSAAPNAPATTVSPPASAVQGLPSTGAPAGLLGLTAAALASILTGAGLLRRGRRNAES